LNIFIVVPDGLAADADGNPLLKPSFVFRPVLEATAGLTQDSDTVYVAPGNNFGAMRYEQEVAAEYLRTLKPAMSVIAPVIATRGYIDTFGNARFLKPALKHDIASTQFVLICTQIHSLRAELCFRMAGYKLLRVERVRYPSDREPVVRRLWYYRHPVAYVTYEFLALLRDLVQFLIRSTLGRRNA
jgi:hypothetical protein